VAEGVDAKVLSGPEFERAKWRVNLQLPVHSAAFFGPRDRLHSGGGSCPRTAPPVLGAKSTCHGRGACAAGGAAPSAVTHRLRSGSTIGHDRLASPIVRKSFEKTIEPERSERVARDGAAPLGAQATPVTSALCRAPSGAVPRQDLLAEWRRSRGAKSGRRDVTERIADLTRSN
jgi:hypothetical protein